MGVLADSIVESARVSRRYADRLLKDVLPDRFARRPKVGGVMIHTNHPAFVYGHLAFMHPWMASLLVTDGSHGVAVPAGYEALFKDGVECRDDPDGTIYPPMKEITDAFFSTFDRLCMLTAATPDEALSGPTPDAKARAFMPTVGAAAVFMLNSHVMMHMGQVSVWRRCMGLGQA